MSKSNLIAFRLPAELQTLFNDAVSNSGSDKTAWIVFHYQREVKPSRQ